MLHSPTTPSRTAPGPAIRARMAEGAVLRAIGATAAPHTRGRDVIHGACEEPDPPPGADRLTPGSWRLAIEPDGLPAEGWAPAD